MKILPIRGMVWNEADRLKLLELLGKLGYRVQLGRYRLNGTSTGAWVYYIEYDE